MTPRRLRLALWALVALAGIGAGLALLFVGRPGGTPVTSRQPSIPGPDAVWAAGAQPAPPFALHDENGIAVSLAAFRGGPVIVTFLDPLCKDFCPVETRVLDRALAQLPVDARPAVVAVSTNVYGNARAVLVRDNRRWGMGRGWHWAVGTHAELAHVWRDYHVAVLVKPDHDIVHTEAAYLVDAQGNERALFLWPFGSAAVVRALRSLD